MSKIVYIISLLLYKLKFLVIFDNVLDLIERESFGNLNLNHIFIYKNT